MYYYKDGETKTIKVDKLPGDIFCYRTRETRRRTLDPANISVIPTEQYKTYLDQRIEKPDSPVPTYKRSEKPVEPGKLYSLLGNRVYKFEKAVDNDRVCVNIVSQYSGEEDNKLTLTEDECELLGIDFKPGLIALSPFLKLREYDPNYREFDLSDLSTYPTSMLEGSNNSIRYMILCLHGFKRTEDKSMIETPDGSFIDLELFIVSLKIKVRENIPSGSNYSSWLCGDDVSWTIIPESFKGSERIDNDEPGDVEGNMYVILKLIKNGRGISPFSLKNKTAGEIFQVSWDNSFSVGGKEPQPEEKVEKLHQAPRYDLDIFHKDEADYFWRSMKSDKQEYKPLIQRG